MTTPPTPPAAPTRRFFVLGVLLLNLLVIGVATLHLLDSRKQRHAETLTTGQNLALMLENDLRGQFERIELALQALGDTHALLQRGGFDAAAWHAALQRQHARLPTLQSILATDADGILRHGLAATAAGPISIADRDYFIRLRDTPGDAIVISRPLLARTTQIWMIVVARRLDTADGRFAGIVLATLPLAHFSRMFESLKLGPHGSIGLRDGERRLIARHPPLAVNSDIGSTRIADEFAAALATQPVAGSYQAGASSIDGVRRLHTYRYNARYDFFINVGAAEEDYLATWQGELMQTLAYLLMFAGISALLVWHHLKTQRSQAAALEQLRQSENRFRLMFERTADALLLLDPVAAKFIDCNQAAVEMLCLQDKAASLPLHPAELSPSYQPDGRASLEKAGEMIATAMEKGSHRFEWIHRSPFREDFPVEVLLTPIVVDEQPLIITTWRDISERKAADAAIREERRVRETLIDAIPGVFYALDRDGRFVFWNRNFERATGRSSEEMQATNALELFAGSDREHIGERIARVFEHGEATAEAALLRKHGAPLPYLFTGRRIELGGRELLVGAGFDISERKQAEASLLESEHRFSNLVHVAPFGTVVVNRDGQINFLNPTFTRILGYTAAELPDVETWWNTAYPDADYRARVQADWQRNVTQAKSNSTVERAYRVRHRDGHSVDIRFMVVPLDDQRILVTLEDITERRRDEERQRLASTILASTAEGVMVTDANSNLLSVNRAFTEITGYSEAEVLGRNANFLRSERHDAEFYQALWNTLKQAGVWQGEIWNRRKNGEIFPEWLTITAITGGNDGVTHYVGVFSDISSLKRSQDELERLAHFDPLTELPNRALFQDRLEHAIDRATRYGHMIALLLLDLDGFKTVNDSLGHPVGDQLLQEVARRLKTCVRVEDTVSRMGGDEFALILANMREGSDAIEVVRKILASIQIPLELDGQGAHVTASIGIAIYPADGETPIDLMRNADVAMYGAKEAGRNAYRFYQSSMTHRAQERLTQERALRRAIEQDEFEVWFQPQINLATQSLTGAEALVRWRDPQRGLVPPGEFIPLAERTGLIIPISALVLDKVCALARTWLDAGLDFGRLAINIASLQIDRGDFVGTLSAALQKAAVPAHCIEIEITESLIMENPEHAREALLAVQNLGVTVAVDDFGTGYSSLAYLKLLPIDNLKIDRAFVKDLPDDSNDAAIARAIISMAHSLGFKVIAEGIETAAQRDYLRGEGCDEAQGYLISRPLPAAEFAQWLRERPSSH
jgi:diguanylate cyclase (GGDEF)-like protein/PAS domain S-box-containing protein